MQKKASFEETYELVACSSNDLFSNNCDRTSGSVPCLLDKGRVCNNKHLAASHIYCELKESENFNIVLHGLSIVGSKYK